ncbi:uncharacterized protein LOC114253910 [Monomorium pharaonis]|uniref:uncharacterized protein LOC114253910 n=1 Tax=Monomorium pharaonis TaxID=307658 RepID=UPI001747D609|nr:uncharacterized protein LOC114253910 [Monomorium pharaonis]
MLRLACRLASVPTRSSRCPKAESRRVERVAGLGRTGLMLLESQGKYYPTISGRTRVSARHRACRTCRASSGAAGRPIVERQEGDQQQQQQQRREQQQRQQRRRRRYRGNRGQRTRSALA